MMLDTGFAWNTSRCFCLHLHFRLGHEKRVGSTEVSCVVFLLILVVFYLSC